MLLNNCFLWGKMFCVTPYNQIDLKVLHVYSNISWRPVLVVEEAGVPGENLRPLVNFITCSCESSAPFFCNLQRRARTHAVLVIGLYELLGNPTT
jgi:hypothetical protein